MPVVVRTDRKAAAARRALMARSPSDRRVRVRVNLEGEPAPGRETANWLPSMVRDPLLLGGGSLDGRGAVDVAARLRLELVGERDVARLLATTLALSLTKVR
jgi:hypothetical protein